MKRTRLFILGLAGAGMVWALIGHRLPAAGADPQAPPLSTYEQQKSWVEGTGTEATIVTEGMTVTRKGNSFIVSAPGSEDEQVTRDEFLRRLKLHAARNHTLVGRYLDYNEVPTNIEEFIALITKESKPLIFDGSVVEMVGPDKFELTTAASHGFFSRADLKKNFARAQAQRNLTACKSNLKNIGTACEMYSTDFGGNYPPSLKLLTPNYLKKIPQCPAAPKPTYTYQMAVKPDAYTAVCKGGHHKMVGMEADFPKYSSLTGLINTSKELHP